MTTKSKNLFGSLLPTTGGQKVPNTPATFGHGEQPQIPTESSSITKMNQLQSQVAGNQINAKDFQIDPVKIQLPDFSSLPPIKSYVPQIQEAAGASREAGLSALERMFKPEQQQQRERMEERGITGSGFGESIYGDLLKEQGMTTQQFLSDSEANEMQQIISEYQRVGSLDADRANMMMDAQVNAALQQGDIDKAIAIQNSAVKIDVVGLQMQNQELESLLIERGHNMWSNEEKLRLEGERIVIEESGMMNDNERLRLEEENLIINQCDLGTNSEDDFKQCMRQERAARGLAEGTAESTFSGGPDQIATGGQTGSQSGWYDGGYLDSSGGGPSYIQEDNQTGYSGPPGNASQWYYDPKTGKYYPVKTGM